MPTIDDAKMQLPAEPKWRLSRATIYQSPEGFTFSSYLDPAIEPPRDLEADADEVARTRDKLDKSIEARAHRIRAQIDQIAAHFGERPVKLLDIGSGGGAFLMAARKRGYDASGIEVDPEFLRYSRAIGLPVEPADINTSEFIAANAERFDAVTLWDVIEHVNFPHKTMVTAFSILKPGGTVFLDTPAKDAFYHRFGEITYRLTGGKVPSFLNIMYSDQPFGHKQIFSTEEMKRMLEDIGFRDVRITKLHELSMPYFNYIRNMTRSELAGRLLAPLASLFFKVVRIRNKMIVSAVKPG